VRALDNAAGEVTLDAQAGAARQGPMSRGTAASRGLVGPHQLLHM
jgi:hypothetical protein